MYYMPSLETTSSVAAQPVKCYKTSTIYSTLPIQMHELHQNRAANQPKYRQYAPNQ